MIVDGPTDGQTDDDEDDGRWVITIAHLQYTNVFKRYQTKTIFQR